ncbi:transposase [Streptomyces sp. BBFR51]|uniref:IS110 family transposase n=1 Tax=Streptomyces sp. BBFR51 TaxID=3372856 RepID=UPI0037DD7395
MDIGKEHHHSVVVDERGERLLSHRVFNDEQDLLELIAAVLALSGNALWAGIRQQTHPHGLRLGHVHLGRNT